MRIIGETRYDFMSRRHLWLAASAVLVVAAIAVLMTRGVQKGVEFTGGAQVILRTIGPPDLNSVRSNLAAAGIEGVSVTTSELQGNEGQEVGADAARGQDLMIRLALPKRDEAEESTAQPLDLTTQVMQALRPPEDRERLSRGLVDLNTTDQSTLTDLLVNEGSLDRAVAEEAAELVIGWRRTHGGVFGTADQATGVPELPEEAAQFLSGSSFTGAYGLRGQEFIEASVSGEMREKAQWAIIGALVGMLIYIWIRFQFQWGVAAIIALVHDTLLTLGAFSIAGMEANLPVVAAFLTLVGYSVNDTIVVLDRVRENLRSRGEGKLEQVINKSINQNLSRTLITSLTTWLVVLSLFLLGGPVIRPFAFVLLIGIVVGTYSSIYIASPTLLLWQRFFGAKGVSSTARGQQKRTRKEARATR